MELVKRIKEGEMCPAWYGLAYIDYLRNEGVCMPLGISLVVGLSRALALTLISSYRDIISNPRAVYTQGFIDGRNSK